MRTFHSNRHPFGSSMLASSLFRELTPRRLAPLQRLFEDALRSPEERSAAPFEVSEAGGGLLVRLPLPGFGPQDVELTLADRELTISAQRGTAASDMTPAADPTPSGSETPDPVGGSADKNPDERVVWAERPPQVDHVRRTLELPRELAIGEISALVRDGVLEVTIAAAPETGARRIEVKRG